MVDQNRCVLCARCVRASRDIDGKNVFEFTGRSTGKMVAPNGAGLADTDIDASDKAVEVCPVGALLKKRVGYKVPVGNRPFDQQPIGSQVEQQPVSE
jgi:[NiFe] hydrogenase diaphorase moiety small subunit